MTNLAKACLVCPDVSEFQPQLTTAYKGDFLIMRVSFGSGYTDRHFLANANAAAALYKKGTLKGVLLYVVLTKDSVQAQFDHAWKLIGPKVPDWLAGIMIDVESWRGTSYSLSGDHSATVNKLAGMHAHKMGSWDSVIVYGNRYDLASLAPGRDKRLRCVVASYSDTVDLKSARGAIGQQYTDGSLKWSVPKVLGKLLRRATLPFGSCDHNVFPGVANGDAMVKLLRPDKRVVVPKPTPAPVSHPVPVPVPVPAPPAVKHSTVELRIDGKIVYSKKV